MGLIAAYKTKKGEVKRINRSDEQIKVRDKSLARMKEMEKDGFIVQSARYGKIAVEVGEKIRGGFNAVRACGCSSYVIWRPEEKSFFITTRAPLPKDFLSQGIGVRETMWVKPRPFPSGKYDEPLAIPLSEVLLKMTDGEFQANGKLKEYLDKEKQGPEAGK